MRNILPDIELASAPNVVKPMVEVDSLAMGMGSDPVMDQTETQSEPEEQYEEPQGVGLQNSNDDHLNEYEKKIEELYSDGLLGFTDLPDEFKGREFGPQETIALLEYSLKNHVNSSPLKIEEEKQKVFEEIVDSMPDFLRQAYEFQLKSNDESETRDFLRGLVIQKDIQSLDAQRDAEEIIRQYGKATNQDQDEIEETIADYKAFNKLEKKAAELQPKLNKISEQIAQRKLEEERRLEDYEASQKQDLSARLESFLSKNSIAGIPLDNDTKSLLRDVIVNDEVTLKIKNKPVTVGGAEALMFFHKYGKGGDLEQLSKAILTLLRPDLLENHYKRDVQQKETQRFLKDHKVSSQIKTGLFSQPEREKKPRSSVFGKL